MLREVSAIRQKKGNLQKRWFTDSDMDLFVWLNNQMPVRFQLSYNKSGKEHALNWNSETGFSHNRVDSGESSLYLKYKMTPILLPDGAFDAATIARQFLQASEKIEESLADFIYARLLEYPTRLAIHSNRRPVPKDL